MLVSLLLGILVGAVLGLTGAGGGILAVPALVFGLGWSMQQAAPVALIAVAAGAAIGAIQGFRLRLVRYRGALLMAAAGMLVAPLGLHVAQLLPQNWLSTLFAVILLLVAVRLLRKDAAAADAPAALPKPGSLHPKTGRFIWSWATALLLGAIGAATGFMTGLLGVGGGFVMVPMLRRFTDVSMHGIVATSLLVIALVSTASVASALMQGAQMPLQITLSFAAATATGMLSGRLLSSRLNARQVQIGFAVLLIAVAFGMFWKALSPA